jgi:hypothetical protein
MAARIQGHRQTRYPDEGGFGVETFEVRRNDRRGVLRRLTVAV